ncbi:cytochrome P450 CYP82D47-like [Cucumis melo var. makuwa]|uniref:Cytochrome P450 CYP82D47-like n=1 Tax=Cucumis melo var. makuwa TaxID=1194695 RepID=A0A5A7VN41_CUCMM|nr:cytochrome P450 CYP82D47-like [Cucumis melo var. makuwa]TYK04113.1 cytochrome P450 CYP82D47-like [Cucumis melo var. makuwa]
MNESRTSCSRYLSEVGTRFAKDEKNDDSIPHDEVIGDIEVDTSSSLKHFELYKRHQRAFPDWFRAHRFLKCVREKIFVMISSHLGHRMDEHIEDDTLCRPDVDLAVVERPIVHHALMNSYTIMKNNYHIKADQAIMNNNDESCTMSSFPSSFEDINSLFLEFDDTFNNARGSS